MTPIGFINSDCKPNAKLQLVKGRLAVIALRMIKIGEDITIHYGSEYFTGSMAPPKAERKGMSAQEKRNLDCGLFRCGRCSTCYLESQVKGTRGESTLAAKRLLDQRELDCRRDIKRKRKEEGQKVAS